MSISVIITWVDDPDLLSTVQSIRDTSDGVEVIVVDDASGCPCTDFFRNLPADRIIRNEHRCGVGPSRSRGVALAKNDVVLIVDSHMRFLPDWAPIAIDRVKAHPQTIFSPICFGLDRDHMNPAAPAARYFGAEWNLSGLDRQDGTTKQVFELVWRKTEPADNEPIQGVMGGAYLTSKAWFEKLGALKFLRTYGSDEQMMSLKSWRSGGDTRLLSAFGIGHRFLATVRRPGGKTMFLEKQPFSVPSGHVTWNKLFSINTLLPSALAEKLTIKVVELGMVEHAVETRSGVDIFNRDFHLVLAEQAYNASLFTTRFESYCERFGISLNF